MSQPHYVFCLLLATISLIGCQHSGESSSTVEACDGFEAVITTSDLDASPRPATDAEQLSYEGDKTLLAIDNTYERVLIELAAIRNTAANSGDPEIASIAAVQPRSSWDNPVLFLIFDAKNWDLILDGSYFDWDCSNEFYKGTPQEDKPIADLPPATQQVLLDLVAQVFGAGAVNNVENPTLADYRTIQINFGEAYNMNFMASIYSRLDGILFAQTEENGDTVAQEDICLGIETEIDAHHYIFVNQVSQSIGITMDADGNFSLFDPNDESLTNEDTSPSWYRSCRNWL
ncbi:MAG TPA: hypothetical protein DCZ03_03705 [Gammaproteobacteria bacterium]|nr:hypothetical protein [Gammaproteobacteria bacterium]